MCPGVSVASTEDGYSRQRFRLTFNGFEYECELEQKYGDEYDDGAEGRDSLSIRSAGEPVFEASASRYENQWASSWGEPYVTAYREGAELQNLIAAVRAISDFHQRRFALDGEESKRRLADEARKKFGI